MVNFNSGSLICERYILGPLEVNTYLVYEKGSSEGILIDPAEDSQTILKRLRELDFKTLTIFLTHGHADHIQGVEFFRKNFPGSKVAISGEDAAMLPSPNLNLSMFIGDAVEVGNADVLLNDGDTLRTGAHEGTLVHIAGHTPGGMALIFDGMVFSGDTLFAGSVGRSDFPGGDGKQLIKGIKEKIFSLSNRQVFPGHGPETTIADEKSSNPFFGTFFNI